MNTTTAPTVFQFHTHEVRTIVKAGEPWFVASDVAKALDYRDAEVAARHLDDDEKAVHPIGVPSKKGVISNDTLGGGQKMTVINESGLYALVLRSRKPEARKFAKWVTSEVLPAIRKTGSYSLPFVVNPADKLTEEQQNYLREMIRTGAEKLEKEKWGVASIKQWAALKAHFKTGYREIPQSEFSEAVSIIARFQADWELEDEPKPERRQLLVERDGVTMVIDASDKSLVRADHVHALRRDFKAMQDAMVEISHRMRICFGDINASDLIEPLTVNLDQTSVGIPAQRRAA